MVLLPCVLLTQSLMRKVLSLRVFGAVWLIAILPIVHLRMTVFVMRGSVPYPWAGAQSPTISGTSYRGWVTPVPETLTSGCGFTLDGEFDENARLLAFCPHVMAGGKLHHVPDTE